LQAPAVQPAVNKIYIGNQGHEVSINGSQTISEPRTPVTERQAPRSEASFSSSEKYYKTPLRGIDSSEYTGKALGDFLNFCANSYRDRSQQFLNSLQALQEQDIGIDIFRDAAAENGGGERLIYVLTKELGFTYGLAHRIVRSFVAWRQDEISKLSMQAVREGLEEAEEEGEEEEEEDLYG
jgi:hypothetical protein